MGSGAGVVYIVQHVDFEGPGIIPRLLERHGYASRICRVFEGGSLPTEDELRLASGVILMGGPMNVDQVTEYPWLKQEVALVGQVVALDLPLLGICLGAQIIAAALGAEVHTMAEPEIGWFPVAGYLWGQMQNQQVLHWHGQRFGIPNGAINLVESAACREQAFRFRSRVVGLQFHLEVDEQGLEGLISHGGEELSSPGVWVQSPQELREGYRRGAEACEQTMDRVLSGLFPDRQGVYTRGWG